MKCMKLVGFLFTLFAASGLRATPLYFQPIQICDDAGNNCAVTGLFEAATDKIWAQAGIDPNFLSIAQLHNTDYLNVTTEGPPLETVGEFRDVMAAGSAMINDWSVSGIINVFFVEELNASPGVDSGYGFACGGGGNATPACSSTPAVFIASRVIAENRLDTLAHEIGHVLGLRHTDNDPDFPNTFRPAGYLMAPGGVRTVPGSIADISPDGAGLSRFTDPQLETVQQSRYLSTPVILPGLVPAPASWLLFVFGLFAMRLARRRSR